MFDFSGIKKDFRIVIRDFTRHFLYTLLIIGVASAVTYLAISTRLDQQISRIVQQALPGQTTGVFSPPENALYVERG